MYQLERIMLIILNEKIQINEILIYIYIYILISHIWIMIYGIQPNNKSSEIIHKKQVELINHQEFENSEFKKLSKIFDLPAEICMQNVSLSSCIIQQNMSHIEEYQYYFQSTQTRIQKKIQSSNQSTEWKIKHKIVIMNNQNGLESLIDLNNPKIVVIGNQFNGLIIKYEVLIGDFKISIDMLNKNTKAPNQLYQIGKGGYGAIFSIAVDNHKKIVCKRTSFRQKTCIWPQNNDDQGEQFRQRWEIQPNAYQIEEVIREYSIYKICSFYKIGPSIIDCIGFDLVCFSDCIEFYMDKCRHRLLENLQQLQQLKVCVGVMHKIKIIHKDIKPANILYSDSQGCYILTDFGISHPVNQKIGECSKTYREGTSGYYCPQMNALQNKQGFVDLYYNDMYCLQVTMRKLQKLAINNKNCQKKQKKSFSKLDVEYVQIKLLYMVINNDQSETLQFIKQNKFEKIFFQNLIKLSKFSYKYRQIADTLIRGSLQLSKYKQLTKEFYIQDIKKLQIEQIQYFVRVYKMTAELLEELEKYTSNWRIQLIREYVRSNYKLKSYKLQNIRILTVTAQPLKYIRSLQRKLEMMRMVSKGQDKPTQIKIMFTLFNLKIEYPLYFSEAQNLHKELGLYQEIFQLNQKIQYQMNSIILKGIRKKHTGNQYQIRIKQILSSYPQETIKHYYFYIKIVTSYLQCQYVFEQYKLVRQLYPYFKKYHQMDAYFQITIKILKVNENRNSLQGFQLMLNQLESSLKQQGFFKKFYLNIMMIKGSYYRKIYRIKPAIQAFQSSLKFIREIYGQNDCRILTCNVQLGRCYLLLYNLQKAQRYCLECYDKISDLYGECNQQFIICIYTLVLINIKKNDIQQVLMYYEKWNTINYKIYINQNKRTIELYISILKFCFLNQYTEHFERINNEIQSKYYKILNQYDLLRLKYVYYDYMQEQTKKFQIIKLLEDLLKNPMKLQQRIYLRKQLVKNYSIPMNFADAEKTLLEIIECTKSDQIIHIDAVFQLGSLYFQNKSFKLATLYSKTAYKLYKEAQIQNLEQEVLIVSLLYECLVYSEQINESFCIFQSFLAKCNIKYLVRGVCTFKTKLAEYYNIQNQYTKSKRLLLSIMKDIKSNYPNMNQQCSRLRFNKKVIDHLKKQLIVIYPNILLGLYQIYKRQQKYFHSLYYFENLRFYNIYDEEFNIYFIFYKRFGKKKKLALKYILQDRKDIIKKYQKLIQFYLETHDKINVLILLTHLFSCIFPQNNMIFSRFQQLYKAYQTVTRFRLCKQIILNGQIIKKQHKHSQMLKKIGLHKRTEYLNRKLSLGYRIIAHKPKSLY